MDTWATDGATDGARTTATIELRFSPLPVHVRTARLIAAAIARRCGVDEILLDEIRLAVGEACSRAVVLHARTDQKTPVTIRFAGDNGRFMVAVHDGVADPIKSAAAARPDEAEIDLGLAVIRGLVDELEIETLADGGEVRMSWPAAGRLN